MLTLPIVVACLGVVIVACLLYRPGTHWVALLILSVLSAWMALICGAGVELSQDGETTTRALGIAGSILGLLALVLLLLSLTSARASWRDRRNRE